MRRLATPTKVCGECQATRPHGLTAAPTATAATEKELADAVLSTIEDSLCTGLFSNAIFFAERLYEERPTYRHLHILASCHARGGGAATACRLLQNYYPFFEVHVTRPQNAGPSMLTPAPPTASLTSVGGGGTAAGTSRARHGSPLGVLGGRRASPRTDSPLSFGVRPALRRGDSGEALLSYAPVDLAARWDCQYLYGVSCAQTGRYTEGTKVLEELLRVCARLEAEEAAHSAIATAELQDTSEEEDEEDAADPALTLMRHRLHQQQLKSLGSCTAGCPRYYVQRVGEVQYWLGVCAQRQHLDSGPELCRSAYQANPLLFSAYEGYVQTAWRPSRESCLRVYMNPEPHLFFTGQEQSASAAAAASTAAAVPASPPPTTVGREATRKRRQQQRRRWLLEKDMEREREGLAGKNALRRFLEPYARAAFLSYTFRCQEAQRALQPANFPPLFAPQGGATDNTHEKEEKEEEEEEGRALAATRAVSPWRLAHCAMCCFHYGDMQGSAAFFQQLLASAPWRLNDPCLMYYSTALWQLRAEGDLGGLAQRLTEEMPMSPITLVVVANTYSLAREPKDAIAMLDRAIQMDSGAAYAHALRGYELLATGTNREARDAFNKAINTDHNMYTAYAGLGELSVREEEVEAARQYFKQAIALNPLPTIMNRYAATHHRRAASREDLLAAFAIYSEAIRHNSKNVSARHQRADVLLLLGKAKEAMADVQDMIQHYPDEAMLFLTLARCQEALGLTRQAVMSYHRAMTLDPRREGYIRGCIEKLSAAASGEADEVAGVGGMA